MKKVHQKQSRMFLTMIQREVEKAVRQYGMQKYDESIPYRLIKLKARNRRLKLHEGTRYPAAGPRGRKKHIMGLVNKLIKGASKISKSENRTKLTSCDFDKAYKRQFFQVWPFC